MTAHGGTNPNASCSRLVSRMVISSALAPARLSLAPCSPPSRTLRAASRWPAAILDRSCAQRLRELRPGRRNGSQPNRETPDQPRDWLSLPTPNSEEAEIEMVIVVPERAQGFGRIADHGAALGEAGTHVRVMLVLEPIRIDGVGVVDGIEVVDRVAVALGRGMAVVQVGAHFGDAERLRGLDRRPA